MLRRVSALLPVRGLLQSVLRLSPHRGFAAPASGGSISGTQKAKLEKARRAAKKKNPSQLVQVRSGPTFHLEEAIRIVRATGSPSSFPSTVNLQVQLGIDPRKTEQAVRGTAALPHGTGKRVVVAVFARGEKAAEARAAGATMVGDVDLAERVAKGELGFTKAIATPDMMPTVGKVARILGPRGLMPNPKMGTVTLNIKEAVAAAMRGAADFRSEKRGIVAAAVGKAAFTPAALKDNVRAFMLALWAVKPETFKGVFFKQAFLSSTFGGPAIPLDMAHLDPTSGNFMADWDGVTAHVVAEEGAGAGAGAAGLTFQPMPRRKTRVGVTGARLVAMRRKMGVWRKGRVGGGPVVSAPAPAATAAAPSSEGKGEEKKQAPKKKVQQMA